MFKADFIRDTTSFDALASSLAGSQTAAELGAHNLSAALLKSYLVEVRIPSDRLEDTFRQSDDFKFYQTSPGFFQVLFDSPRKDESQGAFFEVLSERVGVLYTKDSGPFADSRAEKLSLHTEGFERLHITGPSFMGMWNEVSQRIPGYRFVEIGCRKDQIISLLAGQDFDLVDGRHESTSSNLVLRDTVSDLQESLTKLQAAYSAFRAIRKIRLPSRNGGGNAIYGNGKVTNRCNSLFDHRQVIAFLASFYGQVLERTERLVRGVGLTPVEGIQQGHCTLTYRFPQPFHVDFVEKLVKEMFAKGGEVKPHFQIRGKPISFKKGHYQIYGIDGREFVPINLEITKNHILAMIDRSVSVSGSVIHRLISNLQLYVVPPAEIWLENVNLLRLAEDAARSADFDHFDFSVLED